MGLKPDVEVLFDFIGSKRESIFEGYRPTHLVKDDYLTTGIHNYYNLEKTSNCEVKGTITFISPDEYPACLWEGKKIKMYEGKNMIGYATIISIFNPILQKHDI